jgi:hypothetical protein
MDGPNIPGRPDIGAPGLLVPGAAAIGQGGLNAQAAEGASDTVTYGSAPLIYQSAPITYA